MKPIINSIFINPETGNKRLYFKSKEPFTVISEEPDMALLLLFNNKQIKLLDHNRETLIDISDVNQKIGFSTFSRNKRRSFIHRKNWRYMARAVL